MIEMFIIILKETSLCLIQSTRQQQQQQQHQQH